ncbi:hypothetical protein Tco_0300024 [Tanacetum coccineum]
MTGSVAPITITVSDKLLTVHNFTFIVLVKLDVDKLNYSSWVYFFKNLCNGSKAIKHILGESIGNLLTSAPPPSNAENEEECELEKGKKNEIECL